MELKEASARLKITPVCNKSCSFCHGEGDMQNILPMNLDDSFKNHVQALHEEMHINRFMLTGGEPTLHPQFREICEFIKTLDCRILVTTNGISPIDWNDIPVDRVAVSFHSPDPLAIQRLESRKRTLAWCENSVAGQLETLRRLHRAGIESRINLVAADNSVLESVLFLLNLKKTGEYSFVIRLMDDFSHLEESQARIQRVIEHFGAAKIAESKRVCSSCHTDYFSGEKADFTVKLSYPFFFEKICGACPQRSKCAEGFYGIRTERRKEGYFVRLCLLRSDKEVLMPIEKFIRQHRDNFLNLEKDERKRNRTAV